MFIATIPSVLYIDKLGRKPMLTAGAIGMATCHIIIAVIVAKNRDSWDEHKAAGWAAVAMVWFVLLSSSPPILQPLPPFIHSLTPTQGFS